MRPKDWGVDSLGQLIAQQACALARTGLDTERVGTVARFRWQSRKGAFRSPGGSSGFISRENSLVKIG